MQFRDRLLSICLCLSSRNCEEGLRLVERIISDPSFQASAELHLIAAGLPVKALESLHKLYSSGMLTTLVDVSGPLPVSRMQLAVFAAVKTPYLLNLDSSAVLTRGWLEQALNFIRENDPFDAAGSLQPVTLPAGDGPAALLQRRPWWKSRSAGASAAPSGNTFLLRTMFQRQHCFPDFGMSCESTGWLLSELINQSAGTLLHWQGLEGYVLPAVLPADAETGDLSAIDPQSGFERSADGTARGSGFTVCVSAYGDFPQISLRGINQLIDQNEGRRVNLFVGANACSPRVSEPVFSLRREGAITTLVMSQPNINKCGLQRVMYRLINTPYLVTADDDMQFKSGFLEGMQAFINQHHPLAAAGSICGIFREIKVYDQPLYQALVEAQPWWRGKKHDGPRVFFPLGGCCLINTAFARRHDFPTESMRIDLDDVMLGDLAAQWEGKLVSYSAEILSLYENDNTPRRGTHGQG